MYVPALVPPREDEAIMKPERAGPPELDSMRRQPIHDGERLLAYARGSAFDAHLGTDRRPMKAQGRSRVFVEGCRIPATVASVIVGEEGEAVGVYACQPHDARAREAVSGRGGERAGCGVIGVTPLRLREERLELRNGI